MTEDQIERKVERLTDSLDKRFMNGAMMQEQYDAEITALDKWATMEYRRADKSVYREDFRNYQ